MEMPVCEAFNAYRFYERLSFLPDIELSPSMQIPIQIHLFHSPLESG